MWSSNYSEIFSVSVMLLVPTMTFTRVGVLLVHPDVACRACLDFIEVLCDPF